MRTTQPLNTDEQRIDSAMRLQHRNHAQVDEALTLFRVARLKACAGAAMLERCADLLLDGVAK